MPIGRHVISLTGSLPDQVVIEEISYSFNIPEWLFRHTDPNEKLEFEAKRVNGSSLPDWLHFNPKTLRFSGKPPRGSSYERVMVIARDSYGNEVHTVFTVRVDKEFTRPNKKTTIAPKLFDKTKPEGKPVVGKTGLSEQVLMAGKLSRLQESRALLDSLKNL